MGCLPDVLALADSTMGRCTHPIQRHENASGPEVCLVRAAIKYRRLCLGRRPVKGDPFGIQVDFGPRLACEISVLIDAAHESRAIPGTDSLSNVGRHIADGQSNAPIIGAVRRRPVEQQHMVQRRLTWSELGKHGLGLVDLDGNLLAACE